MKKYIFNCEGVLWKEESFFNEIVHPESRQTTIEEVDNAVKNKSMDLDYVHKGLMPNGDEKWFQAIIKIIYNKKGEAITMKGTSQDITELYSSRHLLEESELRLKMALEIAQLGRWEENHKTGILYWSDECKNIFEFNIKDAKLFIEVSSLSYFTYLLVC